MGETNLLAQFTAEYFNPFSVITAQHVMNTIQVVNKEVLWFKKLQLSWGSRLGATSHTAHPPTGILLLFTIVNASKQMCQ